MSLCTLAAGFVAGEDASSLIDWCPGWLAVRDILWVESDLFTFGRGMELPYILMQILKKKKKLQTVTMWCLWRREPGWQSRGKAPSSKMPFYQAFNQFLLKANCKKTQCTSACSRELANRRCAPGRPWQVPSGESKGIRYEIHRIHESHTVRWAPAIDYTMLKHRQRSQHGELSPDEGLQFLKKCFQLW